METPETTERGWGRRRLIPAALLAAAVTAVAITQSPVEEWLLAAMTWIESAGPLGAFAFGLLYVIATIVFVPATILSLAAGFLFGAWAGVILVSVCTTVGALAGFLIARYVAHGPVQRRLSGMPRFNAIERAVTREGFKMAFLTRLVPILPFSVLNYTFGLTGVTGRRFLLATWLGMFPTSIAYVYLGAAAGDLTRALARDTPPGISTFLLWGLAVAAIIAIVWLITRRARQELDALLAEGADDSEP